MLKHLRSTELAYIGLGSNLGDRAGYLLLAVRGMLNAGLCVQRMSSIYETEPIGTADEQQSFLNMVAELSGNLPTPEQLMARLLRIEYSLGRRREPSISQKYKARTIDLDLLIYARQQRSTEFLILPHPRLHTRRFVLEPLAELAPELHHPMLNQNITQILKTVADPSKVTRWQAN